MNAPRSPAKSAKTASGNGGLAEHVAGAASASHSTLGRLGEAAVAVELGSRMIPAVWRFAKRRPMGASLLLLGLFGVAYLILPRVRSGTPKSSIGT
jgi:hypothetical protein